MNASQKSKRPGSVAALAEPVSSTNLAEGKQMNTHVNTPTPTSDAITIGEAEIENLWCDAKDLAHQLYFLMGALEESFSPDRGKPCGPNGVALTFQKTGIEATLWLAGQVWKQATSLCEGLETHLDKDCGEEDQS